MILSASELGKLETLFSELKQVAPRIPSDEELADRCVDVYVVDSYLAGVATSVLHDNGVLPEFVDEINECNVVLEFDGSNLSTVDEDLLLEWKHFCHVLLRIREILAKPSES